MQADAFVFSDGHCGVTPTRLKRDFGLRHFLSQAGVPDFSEAIVKARQLGGAGWFLPGAEGARFFVSNGLPQV